MPKPKLPLTGDPEADLLLERDPLALLIGMVLDQQIPMERAFHAPYELTQRLGGPLDAAEIADRSSDEMAEVFRRKPALHRYPGSMAKRVQDLCRHLVEHYEGRADLVWEGAASGEELSRRVNALPGFGKDKAQIFVGLLGKRLGVRPPGWESHAARWATVADVDSPETLTEVRAAKRAAKAAKEPE